MMMCKRCSWKEEADAAIAPASYERARRSLAAELARQFIPRLLNGEQGQLALWKREDVIHKDLHEQVTMLLPYIDDEWVRMHLAGEHMGLLREKLNMMPLRQGTSLSGIHEMQERIGYVEDYYETMGIPPDDTFTVFWLYDPMRYGNQDEDEVKAEYLNVFLATVMWTDAPHNRDITRQVPILTLPGSGPFAE